MNARIHIERLLFRAAVRPMPQRGTVRYGGTHGWTVPEVSPEWTCYTAGVGEETELDQALAAMGCEVVAIDPTPAALVHIEPLLERYARLHLAPVALWIEDTDVEFFAPRRKGDVVNYSITNLQKSEDRIEVPARRLETIAAEYGHDRIDFLKMDIEGAEYAVFDHLPLTRFGTKVLCMEVHPDRPIKDMLRFVRYVASHRWRVVAVYNTDVTFVRY